MGKAFEENEFTHNLGLDQKLFISLHLKTFWKTFTEQHKNTGRPSGQPAFGLLKTEIRQLLQPG